MTHDPLGGGHPPLRGGGRGGSPAVRLSLAAPHGPLSAVSPSSPSAVRAWFERRVPLVLPPAALPVLARWETELTGEVAPSIPGWRPEGPGRSPVEAAPLTGFLWACAEAGSPFTFNALWVEKQGGRSYPFFLDGYDGPLTISKRAYEAAGKRGPRLLLSAVRRDVRALFQLPPGWSLLEVDFKSCHAAIGLALSGDPQLAADLDGDMHQVVGDMLVPDVEPTGRRTFGKQVNNSVLFGVTPVGLRRLAREVLGRDPGADKAAAAWEAWWSRYVGLAAFRAGVEALVRQAQAQGCALEIEAPSGRVSRFSAAEVAGKVTKRRRVSGPDDAWRTVFSAVFRAVEGDLLHRTLAHHHRAAKAGGQPVLPLYDGMLVAAPVGAEDAVWAELEAAANQAIGELGIPKLRFTRK